MTEQIICVKAVDLIADAIERELHRTGAHHFRDASEHEERGDLEEWLVKISDDLNLIIDVPLMESEYECIHVVLSLITHQYLEKKKRDAENNPIKHKGLARQHARLDAIARDAKFFPYAMSGRTSVVSLYYFK